ncbi:potassium channel family protein [Aquifex sp.]
MKKKVFAVIGLGRFGYHIARKLAELGAEVIAVDVDPEKVQQLSDIVTHAYVVDALNEQGLEEAGVFTADTVIVSVGSNIEVSILVVVILLNRGVKDIVAKAINPLHGKVLERLGVSRIVYPEKEMAELLATSLVMGEVKKEMSFAPGYNIFEIEAPEKLTGKSLKELDLRKQYGITVLAIKRGDAVLVNPPAEEVIRKGDILLILASEESVKKLLEE